MAKDKTSFVLYTDQKSIVDLLPDDVAGKLFKHIFSYVTDENPTSNDLILDIAFAPIKTQLKRDLKKYENQCKRNQDNGSKGGRPKKPKVSKKPTGLSGLNEEPKKADNDNDNDNDINKINKENSLSIFSRFQKLFPGKKRSAETEFENFQKKHADWKEVLPLLQGSIENQITARARDAAAGRFVPEWKHLQTWLNQRCWEMQIQIGPNTQLLAAGVTATEAELARGRAIVAAQQAFNG